MAVTHSLAPLEIGNDDIWSDVSEATTLDMRTANVESGTDAREPKATQTVI